MLEEKVKLASESLARSMNRRRFLKQAGTTMFGGLAALAAGHLIAGSALAQRRPDPGEPNCSPPGPYCNYQGGYPPQPNSCHGASCFQHVWNGQLLQCRYQQGGYQAGCWTTPTGPGYWTCCDCECRNAQGQLIGYCGCAQYSSSPVPRPDGPMTKADA